MLMFKKEKGNAIPIEARYEMITIYQGTMEISSPIGEKNKREDHRYHAIDVLVVLI